MWKEVNNYCHLKISTKESSTSNLVDSSQALDLEEAVLGAMLIDKKGVDEVIDILQMDAFYKESHKKIFEAIYSLFQSSEPVDLLTVSSKLRKMGVLEKVGGDFYRSTVKKSFNSANMNFMLELYFKNLYKGH